MKNSVKFVGFIAIAAVMGLVLGCEQEPEKKGPSLLSAPPISEAPGWADVTGISEATYLEAIQLFNGANNYPFAVTLGDSTGVLLKNAFVAKYGQPKAWLAENSALSSYKLDVSVDGTGPAKDKSDVEKTDIISIKGKTAEELKLKGGLTLDQYFTLSNKELEELAKNGDVQTEKSSTSLTFTFPLIRIMDRYDNNSPTTDYLVGGKLIIEYKSSDSETLKDKEKEPQVTAGKDSGESKYAFALTIVNTSTKKAAKFRLSYATKNSNNQRKVSSNSYNESSDLEVYGASDNLLGRAPNRTFYYADSIRRYITSLESILRRN
ncbi:MAG: hypothetical protein FWF55_02320 [Treponema sp.]|nr:hypothetical protein [Treponema sp.]